MRAGLVTAAAFPIALGDECVGVIELYAGDAREPNAEVSALFATVGGQLAAYFARRRVRARARRSFDGAAALVVALDGDGRVEIANGTACAAFGFEEDDLVGRDWFAVAVPEPERAAARAAYASLLAGERAVFAKTPGIAWRWSLARDADGVAVGALGWGEPSPGEGEMGDAAGRRDRLHLVLLLQRLQPVPQPHTATEQDRDRHDVQMVDEPGGEELAEHRRATPDADVLARSGLPSGVECVCRRGVEEVERRAALHLQRRPRAMGQNERRGVERRILSPPSAPLRVVLPARRAELAGAHDLRADAVRVALGEGVVDADSAGGVRRDETELLPEAGREHPPVEPMAGVTERGVGGLAVTGAEAVERDRMWTTTETVGLPEPRPQSG